MQIDDVALAGLKLITPRRFGDHRGFFSETWNAQVLAEAGLHDEFVQDNHSLSAEPGTIRGLHYQIAPYAQAKLVRVTRGAVLDVALDIRRGSPTFGQHYKVILSADNWQQLYVPVGFAHGFCTLEPGTEFLYKVSGQYSPGSERGIMWNDPALGIEWGVTPDQAILSAKDKVNPALADATDLFGDTP